MVILEVKDLELGIEGTIRVLFFVVESIIHIYIIGIVGLKHFPDPSDLAEEGFVKGKRYPYIGNIE